MASSPGRGGRVYAGGRLKTNSVAPAGAGVEKRGPYNPALKTLGYHRWPLPGPNTAGRRAVTFRRPGGKRTAAPFGASARGQNEKNSEGINPSARVRAPLFAPLTPVLGNRLCYDRARSKRSRFITLFQAATKSWTNFFSRVGTSVDFGQGAELGVRTEDEIDTRAGPLEFARFAIAAFEHVRVLRDRLPLRAHVEQVHEEVVGQRLGSLGEDAVLRTWPTLVFRTRMPPTSTVISGAVRVSNCALSISSASAGTVYLPLR